MTDIQNCCTLPTDRRSNIKFMPRIVKDFDQRKQEFFEAARELIFSVGYKKMTVSMIIDKVGVAKGTFYHYFNSKEDLLMQWIMCQVEQDQAKYESIVQDGRLDAITKLNQIFRKGMDWKLENAQMIIPMMKILYDDVNIELRLNWVRQSSLQTANILASVIMEGHKEGVFNTPFPHKIAWQLVQILPVFSEEVSMLILDKASDKQVSLSDALELVNIWHDIIERILGAPTGSILMVDKDFLTSYFTVYHAMDEL